MSNQSETPSTEMRNAALARLKESVDKKTEIGDAATVNLLGRPVRTPYITIFFEPRDTMRHVLEHTPAYSGLIIISVLSLILPFPFIFVLSRFVISLYMTLEMSFQVVDSLSDFMLYMLTFVPSLAPPLAWRAILSFYVVGFLYQIIGEKIFSGKATYTQARLAYAWGLIPVALFLPLAGMFALLAPVRDRLGIPSPVMFGPESYIAFFLMLVLFIYCVTFQVRTLAETHEIKIWQSFVTVSVSIVLMSILFSAISSLIPT